MFVGLGVYAQLNMLEHRNAAFILTCEYIIMSNELLL